MISDIAVAGGHLAWTVNFGDVPGVEIHDLNLRSGRRTLLARASVPNRGLAATREWVAYPEQKGASMLLIARRHDGSRPIVLSSRLTGPVTARGELIAWAQTSGRKQELIVRNMNTRRQRVAAALPRCERERCYRIDDVELAARGVAFTRGALGPYPSQVVRRAFEAARPRILAVPDDPQPDLLPSPSGPLISIAGRGLVRWYFGMARSRPLALPWLGPQDAVLGRVRRLWLVLRSRDGSDRIYARRPDGSDAVAAVPRFDAKRLTATLGAWTWDGRQVFGLWLLTRRTGRSVTDEGPDATIVQAGRTLR